MGARVCASQASRPTPNRSARGEIKRRSEVVGISPNEATVTRVIGALLLEQDDKSAFQHTRYMSLETVTSSSDDPVVRLPPMAA